MKNMIRLGSSVALLFAALSLYAIDLDTAKADGLVGERADGYLGAVHADSSAEVQSLITEINDKRRVVYERIAEQNKIPLSDVEVLAGKKAIEKTDAGGWVYTGQWQQK